MTWIDEASDMLLRVNSQNRARRLVELSETADSLTDLRELLKWWVDCDAVSSGREGEALLELFRIAGYVCAPERRFYDQTIVFRGNLGEDPRLGFSWTLSKARARWFALYAYDSPRASWLGLVRADGGEAVPTVWSATVAPNAILGYFNNRREREVIVDADEVESVVIALHPRRQLPKTAVVIEQ